MNIDFQFTNNGSVITVTPLTERAKKFVERKVSVEQWQYFGNAFALDRRCARDLADAMIGEGFNVQ